MLRRIVDGMYFDCANACDRNARNTLRDFLSKLDIKSAAGGEERNPVYTGMKARIIGNFTEVDYDIGVSYDLKNIGDIPVLGRFSISDGAGGDD